ncbi:hypothetical protein BaRGS_00011824 [Batillaria attramentaria]|uniref:Uncharacterized protein n=1 Tax=Batillaria attramentaria TaxID=370345 RepID=A0ABD0LBH2_9CAEN
MHTAAPSGDQVALVFYTSQRFACTTARCCIQAAAQGKASLSEKASPKRRRITCVCLPAEWMSGLRLPNNDAV